MDPKMDSGFLKPGETLDDNYDVSRALLPEEVVGIMDQLLCYEVAWHHGYPLSQTLFTSIYIDRLLWPPSDCLSDAQFYRGIRPMGLHPLLDVLRSYCIALIKCCDLTIEKVTSRDYYEEEDFSTHTYNRSLLHTVPHDKVLELLRSSIEWLSNSRNRRPSEVHRTSRELEEALINRLTFRERMLLAVAPEQEILDLAAVWPAVSAALPPLEATHSLGRPVPDSFSEKIQRRLASTVPPRPTVDFTFAAAYTKLVQLCKDCEDALRVLEITTESPQEHLSFIWMFSSRKPAPLAYARSCLSSVFLARTTEGFEQLIQTDLSEFVFPADPVLDPVNFTLEAAQSSFAPQDKRLAMATIINEFTGRAAPQYFDMWNSLCQNRCRTRRMICNNIPFIDDLQFATEQLDDELHDLTHTMRYPLSTWVYHMKLRMVEWVVQLGFEQEVYLPDELAGMYWWLSQVASLRASVIEQVYNHLSRRHEILSNGGEIEKAETIRTTQAFVKALMYEATGTGALADAMYALYMRLHYLQLVPILSRPYSESSLRYELRMKPFLRLNPPQIPTFEAFEEATRMPSGSQDDVFAKYDVEGSVKEAKEAWAALKRLGARAAKSEVVQAAWEKNLASTIQSCIACGIAASTISNIPKDAGTGRVKEMFQVEIPGEGKRYHDWWVVPKIKRN
ncbi:hypothetical protein EJ05DRAFT_108735 [Pseudovirgaria hyperparasitica]|uniref:Mak10-domain-containing protein n=1 Tax=Pseudovirgaria hyperparasitica TaxID=470096 RepID=A0A6A6W0F7_9PEZI|nr:uncharacterized protein EJ05DRAFT_108735 [Pseudovirgaria hyperparasitica]KAF2755619.1 hypothetical protein EJ05DRAFT_108735 [Pseudovirgaria hyperparasitica]